MSPLGAPDARKTTQNLDIESNDEWLAGNHQRKLFEIELRCFAKIGNRLLDRVALRGSAGLGVQRNEPSAAGTRTVVSNKAAPRHRGRSVMFPV